MTLVARGLGWIGLYLAVAVVPLVIAAIGHPGSVEDFSPSSRSRSALSR